MHDRQVDSLTRRVAADTALRWHAQRLGHVRGSLDEPANIRLEPTRRRPCAIMSPRRAAQAER